MKTKTSVQNSYFLVPVRKEKTSHRHTAGERVDLHVMTRYFPLRPTRRLMICYRHSFLNKPASLQSTQTNKPQQQLKDGGEDVYNRKLVSVSAAQLLHHESNSVHYDITAASHNPAGASISCSHEKNNNKLPENTSEQKDEILHQKPPNTDLMRQIPFSR